MTGRGKHGTQKEKTLARCVMVPILADRNIYRTSSISPCPFPSPCPSPASRGVTDCCRPGRRRYAATSSPAAQFLRAAEAARRAGYAERSARQSGHALLERSHIVERVRQIRLLWRRLPDRRTAPYAGIRRTAPTGPTLRPAPPHPRSTHPRPTRATRPGRPACRTAALPHTTGPPTTFHDIS